MEYPVGISRGRMSLTIECRSMAINKYKISMDLT